MRVIIKEARESEAREWFLLITSGEATDADIDAFEAWRDSSVENEVTYAALSRTWAELEVLAVSPQGDCLRRSVETEEERAGWLRRFWGVLTGQFLPESVEPNGVGLSLPRAALVGSFLLALTSVALVFGLSPQASTSTSFRTGKAELRSVTLDDGSRITLGAETRLEVVYTEMRRDVKLEAGQAFFEVAKDAARPFFLDAGDADFAVLGTKFDVHRGAQDVTLEVLEGRVRVAPSIGEAESLDVGERAEILTAMQAITVSQRQLGEVTKIDNEPGGWRQGRLAFRRAALGKVIADANRYYQGTIILANEKLAQTYITTSFEVDQIDAFLKSLPDTVAVEVVYRPSGDVFIQPRTKKPAGPASTVTAASLSRTAVSIESF